MVGLNSPVSKYELTLDNNGNITNVSKVEPLNLTIKPKSESYTFLKNIISDDEGSFSHNAKGEMQINKGSVYKYSSLGNLEFTTTAIYDYDGLNNRLKRSGNGETKLYIYDASGNLIAEADSEERITRYYIYGPNGLLAMMTPTGEVYSYSYDHRGNTIGITNSAGKLINRYAYTPFGLANQSEVIPQPFKFVGKFGVMTESSGLCYMKARYYDPQIGRFISQDPLGFAGGDINLYLYGHNNPIMFIDPWGLCGNNTFGGIVKTISSGIGQAFVESAPAWAMAGKVVVLTHAAVAVKAYALFDVATGGPVITAVALANPATVQNAADFVQGFVPGTAPPPSFSGFMGFEAGRLFEKMMNR